nr:hypothetical protein [Candidatus Methylacidiphilum fumarolicum]
MNTSISGEQLPVAYVLLEAGEPGLFVLLEGIEERLEVEIQPLERYLGGLSIDRGEKRAAGTELGDRIGTARRNRCFAFPPSTPACAPPKLGSRGSNGPSESAKAHPGRSWMDRAGR